VGEVEGWAEKGGVGSKVYVFLISNESPTLD
jgi:hypothetical protein